MEKPKVLIKVKRVFGRSLGVPDNKAAEIFTQLTGRDTLSVDCLKLIKDLGFDVVITGNAADEDPATLLAKELKV